MLLKREVCQFLSARGNGHKLEYRKFHLNKRGEKNTVKVGKQSTDTETSFQIFISLSGFAI